MSIKGKTKIVMLLLTGSVFAFASGCSLIPKEEDVLKPPLVKPQKETYELYDVKAGSIIKQIVGTGTFESTNVKYEEFKTVTGKIVSANVILGNKVKQGDILVQLDVDGLEISIKEKERDLEKVKLALEQVKVSRDVQTMKIKMMELDIAENKLRDARKQLDGKSLVAEIDGVVTAVEPMKVGDIVQLNKTYVTIADPNSLRLTYTFGTSTDVQEVQVGMMADVTLKKEKFEAKVVQTPSTAPKTDNKQLSDKYAKTLLLQIEKNPPQAAINTTVDISIVTKKKDNVIKIPTRGLGSYLGRNFVKTMDGDGIKEVDVEKGIESATEIEITKGLKEGQKVILQ